MKTGMGNSARNCLARAVFRFSLRTVAPRSSDYVRLRCAVLAAHRCTQCQCDQL